MRLLHRSGLSCLVLLLTLLACAASNVAGTDALFNVPTGVQTRWASMENPDEVRTANPHRTERNFSQASNASDFQDHLVLETKVDFRIILRLEYASLA